MCGWLISLNESYELGQELELFTIGATSDAAGQLAEQTGNSERVIRAAFRAVGLINGWLNPKQSNSIATNAFFAVALHVAPELGNYGYDEREAFEAEAVQSARKERSAQAGLLREIFGTPFRPVMLDLRWQTSTVVDLAHAIYDQRAFDRMPILADALMDAGCGCEPILQHCRQDGEHVRGCWVVDLLTGRK